MNGRIVAIALLLLGCMVGFQNCSQMHSTSVGPVLYGNGDSYPGLTKTYLSQTQGNPCNQVSTLGNPFPQREIFQANGRYSLVRDNCNDVTPVDLDSSDLAFDPTGQTVVYQGQSFGLQANINEYNLVPTVCPAGQNINTAIGNLFASPLNLTSVDWYAHDGITVTSAGSIDALPNFKVQFTDPQLLDNWRRVLQNVPMQPNKSYVFTFLLSRGNVDEATMEYYVNGNDLFDIEVNFPNKTATVIANLTTIPTVTNVQQYGNGLAVSIAFTSAPDATGITGGYGVTAYRGPPGSLVVNYQDYVYASAASLYQCQ